MINSQINDKVFGTREEQLEKISVVFAGGGCRTFWSLGVIHQIGRLLPEIREWVGVSAGSAMALASAVGKTQETLEYFMARTAENQRNVYFGNLLSGNPVFPHESMYRSAILNALDKDAFDLLKTKAPVRIFAAYVKEGQPTLRTVFRAMRSYRYRRVNQVVHAPEEGVRGMGVEVFVAQECSSPQEICDKVLISSTTPPMTRVPVINRCTYVDGGLVDNVPVRALTPEAREGKVLVLVSRHIPHELLPRKQNYFYLAPSMPTPVAIWDYTSPEKIEETFRLGQRDAYHHLDEIEKFLL